MSVIWYTLAQHEADWVRYPRFKDAFYSEKHLISYVAHIPFV